MRALALLWALVAVGCASPVSPTAHAAVGDAWSRLGAITTKTRWSPDGIGAWARRFDVPVVLKVLPADRTAEYRDGVIALQPSALAMDPAELAGILAHELRHAEGYRHDCGTFADAEYGAGAWTVHVDTLAALEVDGSAEWLRSRVFCDGSRPALVLTGHAVPR